MRPGALRATDQGVEDHRQSGGDSVFGEVCGDADHQIFLRGRPFVGAGLEQGQQVRAELTCPQFLDLRGLPGSAFGVRLPQRVGCVGPVVIGEQVLELVGGAEVEALLGEVEAVLLQLVISEGAFLVGAAVLRGLLETECGVGGSVRVCCSGDCGRAGA